MAATGARGGIARGAAAAGPEGFLGVFAAISRGLAHDARTPLNSIRINAELVRRTAGKLDDEELQGRLLELTTAIDKDIVRIRERLDQLFEVLTPAPEHEDRPLDVAGLVRLAAALVAPEMRRRRIAFAEDIGPFPPENARPAGLRGGEGPGPGALKRGRALQAVVAALTAAAERAGPGGTVSVSAPCDADGAARVEVRICRAAGRPAPEGADAALLDIARVLLEGWGSVEDRSEGTSAERKESGCRDASGAQGASMIVLALRTGAAQEEGATKSHEE